MVLCIIMYTLTFVLTGERESDEVIITIILYYNICYHNYTS